MKKQTKLLAALVGLIFGAISIEQMFLSRLEYSVVHDDMRLGAFLNSIHYPLSIEPGFGFCRPEGGNWGYEYQLCVYSSTAKNCPIDGYLIQYLGPQSKLSIISRSYHDSELQFRVPIYNVDKLGKICQDKREVD